MADTTVDEKSKDTSASKPRPWWKTAVAKVLAGIGTAATAVIGFIWTSYQGDFGTWLHQLTETGDPVMIQSVNVISANSSMAFPNTSTFSNEDISHLDSLEYQEQYTWLGQHGGADLHTIGIQITLATSRTNGVRILDITKMNTQCSAPLHGTIFSIPGQAGAATTQLLLDLDKPSPQVMDQDHPTDPYFAKHVFDIKKDLPETINVTAQTGTQYCTFSLDLKVLDNGRERDEVIQNNGRPFALTAYWDPAQYDVAYYGLGFCNHLVRNDDKPLRQAYSAASQSVSLDEAAKLRESICGIGNVPH